MHEFFVAFVSFRFFVFRFCDMWQPSEGETMPQIRYSNSTNTTTNAFSVDGSTSDTSTNDIADTFVVYINVDNSSTLGLTDRCIQNNITMLLQDKKMS